MGKLSQQERDRLPSHVYGLPDKRAYPMPDRGHAQYAIKVAAIQHSRGNLSAEQYAAIHAKAMHVLHAADGGMVSLRGKSNIQRDLARHGAMALKHFADGGLVDEDAFDTKLGTQHGMGDYSLYDETGGLKTPEQIAHEAGFPTQASGGRALINSKKAATPPPAIPNPSVDSRYAVTGVRGANGGHVSLRDIESMGRNGMVRGPGGPRADKVPAMLSDGEYVLPAKTVKHVGKENLDHLVRSTNDGIEPGVHSLREHYDAGGEVIRNPNIPIPGVTVSPEAAAPSGGMFGSGDDWRRMGNSARNAIKDDAAASLRLATDAQPGVASRVLGAVGKVAKPLAPVTGALETASGIANGDAKRTALGAADTAAGAALYTPAAPAAAVYLAGRTGWDAGKAMYSHLSRDMQDRIGGTINQIGLNTGLWGTNDDTKVAEDQAARASLRSTPTPAASPASSMPAPNNDLRANAMSDTDVSDGTRHDEVGNTYDQQGNLISRAAPSGNQPGSAMLTGRDANGNVTIGYDGSADSLKSAQDRYYEAAAHPHLDPTHVYTHDADGNLIDEGRGDSPSYQARYNEAKYRATAPEYSEEGIQAMHDAVDRKYAPSPEMEASLRGGAGGPGSFDWMAGRRDRAQALQNEMSLRENSTTRRGQDINASVQTYGHELAAKTARMQARIEQYNKDRDYGLNVAKAYGTGGPGSGGGEVGRAEQKAREDAAKSTTDRVASMIPPTKDVKGNNTPDTVTAARYATGLNAVLGQKMEATRQYLAQNPNDTNAAAWLERAQRDGLAALDESDIRKHVSGMQAADLAQKEHSLFNPFKGTAVTSDAPVNSLRYVHRTFLPDYYKSDRGDKIPAYAVDKAGSLIFGLGGQQQHNFDILKQP